MDNEVRFERSWKTTVLYLIVIFVLQLIFIYVEVTLLEKGDVSSIAFIELVVVASGLCLIGPIINQRYIKFSKDGISYLRCFRRQFIRWSEVKDVRNISLNRFPVIQISSQSEKMKIYLDEFSDSKKLVKFLGDHLPQLKQRV